MIIYWLILSTKLICSLVKSVFFCGNDNSNLDIDILKFSYFQSIFFFETSLLLHFGFGQANVPYSLIASSMFLINSDENIGSLNIICLLIYGHSDV